jgi:CubicO group peptidase (beta-lactamase class C family)
MAAATLVAKSHASNGEQINLPPTRRKTPDRLRSILPMLRRLRYPHRATLLIASLFLISCGSDPAGPGSSPDTPSFPVVPMPGLQGFAAELDRLRVDHMIPGMAAALVQDQQIVWSRGLGYADAETNRLASDTTSFHLASLTKPFASVIVMQLVEQRLVDLDDPVSDYGIDLSANGVIRVRHLLTHTSEGVPGSAYSYNGSRFAQLDRVIEGASGHTFGELLVDTILQPLGLRHTAPNVEDRVNFALTGMDREEFIANMASPYAPRGPAVIRSAYEPGFSTAAGMIASARDMAAFSIAIDEGSFLQPETWDLVFTPMVSNPGQPLPYGLGWFIQDHQGTELQWHYGYWSATSTLIVRAPAQGLAFVVLANTDMMSRPYGLGGGDVLPSPFAQLFIDWYVLGDEPLPSAANRVTTARGVIGP